GPWELEPGALAWQAGIVQRRQASAAEVPELTRRRALPPVRRLASTVRHLGPGLARWYVGPRRKGPPASHEFLAHSLRRAAEALGPSYIKLGQIVSSGRGLFPDALVAEFSLLRDRVQPEPFAVVRRVIEEDLGRPID